MTEPEPIPYDPAWSRRRWAVALREVILMGVLRPLVWAHNRPRTHGRERLREIEGPVIVAANHASHLDTPVIMQRLPRRLRRRTGVVAAADYFYRNRLVAALVTLAFATVPIERNGLSPQSRQRVEEMLDERWSMLVYPEGTRSRDGRLGRLRGGTARFAIDHRLPIVPVYVTGTFESHGKGSKWPSRHPVTVRFGDPLAPPADGDARELTERLRAALTELAAESGRSEP